MSRKEPLKETASPGTGDHTRGLSSKESPEPHQAQLPGEPPQRGPPQHAKGKPHNPWKGWDFRRALRAERTDCGLSSGGWNSDYEE